MAEETTFFTVEADSEEAAREKAEVKEKLEAGWEIVDVHPSGFKGTREASSEESPLYLVKLKKAANST